MLLWVPCESRDGTKSLARRREHTAKAAPSFPPVAGCPRMRRSLHSHGKIVLQSLRFRRKRKDENRFLLTMCIFFIVVRTPHVTSKYNSKVTVSTNNHHSTAKRNAKEAERK